MAKIKRGPGNPTKYDPETTLQDKDKPEQTNRYGMIYEPYEVIKYADARKVVNPLDLYGSSEAGDV